MRKPRISRSLLLVAVPAAAAGCLGGGAAPPAFFGRLEGGNENFFAHETIAQWQLEAPNGEKVPELESQWVKVPPNALTNRQFTVVQRSAMADKAGTPYRALELREATGTVLWVRN